MVIANYMATRTDLDKVWMVLSPQNPFKQKSSLANNYDRLHLLRLAIGENLNLLASDIEFGLPVPSYTIDTLTYLKEKYPEKEFSLIMGGDNLATLPKWKNYEKILAHHDIYVYRRPEYELGDLETHPRVQIMQAPLLSISASYIRQCISDGHSIEYLVPTEVYRYLLENPIYGKIKE